MCNTVCENAADHLPHNREQYLPLWGWYLQTMPEIVAPADPIA